MNADTPSPKVTGVFLVRDKYGRPKFDLPMRYYPQHAQDAFRAAMTPDEIQEFFYVGHDTGNGGA